MKKQYSNLFLYIFLLISTKYKFDETKKEKSETDQGIIWKKSAFGSQMLPFMIFDKRVLLLPKVVLF